MYDAEKAHAAQLKYLSDHNIAFLPMKVCYRCHQSIYAETGHPIAARLPHGKVRLDYSHNIPGISVERAGSDSINGCPFCASSFDD